MGRGRGITCGFGGCGGVEPGARGDARPSRRRPSAAGPSAAGRASLLSSSCPPVRTESFSTAVGYIKGGLRVFTGYEKSYSVIIIIIIIFIYVCVFKFNSCRHYMRTVIILF